MSALSSTTSTRSASNLATGPGASVAGGPS